MYTWESELVCKACGGNLTGLATGPPSMPNIHGSYFCPNCPEAAPQPEEETRNDSV